MFVPSKCILQISLTIPGSHPAILFQSAAEQDQPAILRVDSQNGQIHASRGFPFWANVSAVQLCILASRWAGKLDKKATLHYKFPGSAFMGFPQFQCRCPQSATGLLAQPIAAPSPASACPKLCLLTCPFPMVGQPAPGQQLAFPVGASIGTTESAIGQSAGTRWGRKEVASDEFVASFRALHSVSHSYSYSRCQ
jgi:hypothetical protein